MNIQSLNQKSIFSAQTALSCLLLVVLSWLVVSAISQPAVDPDLWWHLKAGEYIFENGKIPDEDPFSHTSSQFSTVREKAILKGYPVAQLAMFFAFDLLGVDGLKALRVLVILSLSLVLLLRARFRGNGTIISLATLCVTIFCFFDKYYLDRPQIYSFVFFALLLLWIETSGVRGWRRWLLVPLMAVWANTHGGFVFGVIVLFLYAGCIAIFTKETWRYKELVVVTVSVLVTFLSAASYTIYLTFFDALLSLGQSRHTAFVEDYVSLTESLMSTVGYEKVANILIVVMFLLFLVRLLLFRNIKLHITLIIVFSALSAFVATRNSAFFLVAVFPYISNSHQERQAHFGKAGIIPIAAMVCIVLWTQYKMLPRVEIKFPVQAADFILENNFSGKMFNDYDSGGYLIWRLYPKHKVFIDGRVLDEGIFNDYSVIARGESTRYDQKKRFSYLLDKYEIDFAVLPLQGFHGDAFPLIYNLLQEEKWLPVYLDPTSTVFVRYNQKNLHVVLNHRIEKRLFADRYFKYLETQIKSNPGSLKAILGYADVLTWGGRKREVCELLSNAHELFPGNPRIEARKVAICQ